ncbi:MULTISPECIES: hypothetical protein [unclassified Streptomyces]|uniref:hypothetical protein n=1 Tax=unclassified Streptomyces TaxID=2593676 RepID=UPI002E121EA2|nr:MULTISPECIES: hypothetical protein [unclassified Streptomyces]WSR22422.1 hypothetical protein OG573_27045 [Streptomyces sp. NBC_01205]
MASLLDEQGSLDWVVQPEPLPLPATPTRRRLSAVPQQATAPEHVSFDAGDQPVPILFARPDVDERRDVPPLTEPDPIEPLAHEDDEN